MFFIVSQQFASLPGYKYSVQYRVCVTVNYLYISMSEDKMARFMATGIVDGFSYLPKLRSKNHNEHKLTSKGR